MRTISAALATKLATQYGTEPINIIEVQWADGGSRAVYADRDIAGVAAGRITDLSGLDFVINVNDGSDSAQISIVLSDVDGDLKNIIDTNDIHKRDVWVYQWFEGIAIADKALIFQGEINSPITWNEGDRTLKFNVISKIEDAEIGFSIEEGQFQNPPTELIGKPWPLKFGTTIKVPALKFSSPAKGVLSTGVGISDFTLSFAIQAAEEIVCPETFRGYNSRYVFNTIEIDAVYIPDEGCSLSRCERINDLKNQLAQQQLYEFTQITIIDGERFPQNVPITLDIDGGKFDGSFSGNVFTITARRHPDLAEIGIPNDSSVQASLRARITEGIASGCLGLSTTEVTTPVDESRRLVEESERSWEFFNAVPSASFFWANPGATVTLDAGEPLVYVTNLLPETIHNVAAFRNFDAGRKLVTVPSSLYTVRFSNFESYTVTEIVLDRPLSQVTEGWEDELYITSTSTVGPNTVDIIQWLIEKYTDFEIDPTSFADVHSKLAMYPSDFPILDRKNILEVLQEIAFQARCVIYLRDQIFYLKYLPELPAAAGTISESDVDSNTLELFHTNTEELVTKLVAEWQRDYSVQTPNKLILRHNIEKYGTQEETFNFYIYNQPEYVHKSATFWLIRKSNTWRMARFSTPIHKLAFETFDGVDLSLPDFALSTIRGTITKADYNSNDRRLDFEIWTPVKSGTQVAYDFAHPHAIDQTMQWPTLQERNDHLIGSGTAPGFLVTAPAGHPLIADYGLAQGFQFGPCESQGLTTKSFVDQTCNGGNGDTYPSDQGDTVKPQQLEAGLPPDSPTDPGEVQVGRGPQSGFGGMTPDEELRKRLADVERKAAQAQAVANAANEAAGGSGSGTQPRKPNKWKDLPTPEDRDEANPEGECRHTVNVYMTRPQILFKTTISGFQSTGFLGTGTIERIDKFYFSTQCEAVQLVNAITAMHNAHQAAEDYQVGQGPYPTNANVIIDTSPECAGLYPPISERMPDGGGKNPTPIAYEEEVVQAPTGEGQEEGTPDDYWDGLTFSPTDCEP